MNKIKYLVFKILRSTLTIPYMQFSVNNWVENVN